MQFQQWMHYISCADPKINTPSNNASMYINLFFEFVSEFVLFVLILIHSSNGRLYCLSWWAMAIYGPLCYRKSRLCILVFMIRCILSPANDWLAIIILVTRTISFTNTAHYSNRHLFSQCKYIMCCILLQLYISTSMWYSQRYVRWLLPDIQFLIWRYCYYL